MSIFTVIGVLIALSIIISIMILKTVLDIKELITHNDNCIDHKLEMIFYNVRKNKNYEESLKNGK